MLIHASVGALQCVSVLLQERERGEANGLAHSAERQLPRQRRPQGKSSQGRGGGGLHLGRPIGL